MYEGKPHTYEEYKEYLSQLLQRLEIAEETTLETRPARSTDEIVAQCIWYEKLLRSDGLKTDRGIDIEIISSGRWNREAGPDFLHAELSIGGFHCKGDIEIHHAVSDWEHHGHRTDPRYRNVILHAYMYKDDDKSVDAGFDGSPIERFCLSRFLFPDLDTIMQSLSIEDYPYGSSSGKGRCSTMWRTIDPEWVAEFFDMAGKERMLGKMSRLADCLVGTHMDQVFYQALMTAMGYKGAKALFFLLSKRTPILELKSFLLEAEASRHVNILQSILLHVANLVPELPDYVHDEEISHYIDILKTSWEDYRPYFTDRILPQTRQWFTGVRPVNFPTRRIAGISHLLKRFLLQQSGPTGYFSSLFRENADISSEKKIKGFLHLLRNHFVVNEPEDFWSTRSSFNSKRWAAPRNLIGASRAQSIVFNALLPMMLLYAREESDAAVETLCWRLFDHFPSLPENVITRFMKYRLFDDAEMVKSLMTNECRQQALFQIFYDCCNNNEVSCEDCYLLRRFEFISDTDDDTIS